MNKITPNLARAAGLALISSLALAAEVKTTGQLQIQADYHEPEFADDTHWALSLAQSRVGLIAIEQLPASLLQARLSVAIDPFDPDIVDTGDYLAYMTWQTSTMSVSAGRLPSLQQALLVDPVINQMSLADNGLSIARFFPAQEQKAIRLDAGYGESVEFSGQWLVDENQLESPWSLASRIQNAEGAIAVTYRNSPDQADLWGSSITWLLDRSALSYSWLMQDGVIAWDASARVISVSAQSFLSYSAESELTDERWTIGMQRALGQEADSYYEVHWWPDAERWQGSVGLKMAF